MTYLKFPALFFRPRNGNISVGGYLLSTEDFLVLDTHTLQVYLLQPMVTTPFGSIWNVEVGGKIMIERQRADKAKLADTAPT